MAIMGMWMKTVLGVAAAVIPGGLLLLLGWGVGRALRSGYKAASVQAQGGPVPVRQVLAGLTLRNIVREAFST